MVDTSASPQLSHLDLAQTLLQAGVSILQLRMKGAQDEEQLAVLRALAQLCAGTGAQLLVNDHVHLAAAVPGVGVHLGQDDGDPAQARALLGDDGLLGLSTHSLAQAEEAQQMGADYIAYGPIFGAGSKHLAAGDQREPHPARGLSSLRRVLSQARVPVVAIGGVDLERLPLLLASGVRCVAAISAITCVPDPLAAAQTFQRSLASTCPSD
jgi:thiamine-phosphate pyrophosphorylase